ncbi:MAG TPA: alpha/beta hydrolase [Streptosporangiaceae bacterium]
MPVIRVNGINVSFDEYGSGDPVVLVTGTGGRGREWTAHQVPALVEAGYRAITVDNRGVPPTDVGPAGFTINDMVGDTVGLIEALGIAQCRIVGFSLGGIIVQEALLARPDLITQAVLMATRGRTDAMRAALSDAWDELDDSGIKLPAKYDAAVRATQYLSPRTLNNEERIRDWLDIFEMSPTDSAIKQSQQGLDSIDNRLEEYRKIKTECLVISFQDDLIVPPFFGREMAECIPDCRYEEIAGCGHYGHLEDPNRVNTLIIDFFQSSGMRVGA